MNIGDVFYLERHKRRLTLQDVACKIGCSALYLSQIETGRVLPLKSYSLSKLCELYGLDRDEIYKLAYEEEYMKRCVTQKDD